MDSSKPDNGRSVKLVAYLLFTSLFLGVIVLSLELYFRSQDKYGRAGFAYDSEIIYRLTPGFVGQRFVAMGQTGEAPYVLRLNDQGFRGDNFTLGTDGTSRILVIGDSYTAGLDYPYERIFTSKWEQLLNQNSKNKAYKIFNASCPAWGSDQQYIFWKNEGQALQPDALVILFSPNDLREMWNHGLVRYDKQGGQIRINSPSLPMEERFLWQLATKSSTFQHLQKEVFNTNYGDFLRIFNYYPVHYKDYTGKSWDTPLFLKEHFPAIDSSYALFEKLIQDIKQDCDKIGAEMHLVKLPILIEFDDTYQDSSIFSPTIVEKRIEVIASRNNINFQNFNARLRQLENPLDVFMKWEYHYDQNGHDWVAKALYKEIQAP